MTGRLDIVGLGPGADAMVTPEVQAAAKHEPKIRKALEKKRKKAVKKVAKKIVKKKK